MNFRLTAILFGTIFVLAAVLLILSYNDDSTPTDALAEELAGLKPADIDAVEIETDLKPGEKPAKLTLKRVDKEKNRWNVTEPFAAAADPAAVNEVVAALLKAKPTAFSGLTPNLAAHGLQPPGLRVTLKAGDKASTINFGEITIGGSKGVVFVTTSARPTRPLATPRASIDALLRETTGTGPAGSLAKGPNDFRVKSVFAADTRGAGDDVNAVTLTAKGKTLALSRKASGGGWKFDSPTGWGDADAAGDTATQPGTFTGVRPLLAALTGLQASGAADFVDDGDLAKYGLNDGNPDLVKVELKNKDGETTTAFIGKRDGAAPTPPATPGMPPQPSAKWWVRVQGQPGVIRAGGGDLGGLVAVIENPDPLRDRTLLALDKNRIDGAELGSVRVFKTGGPPAWKLYGRPEAGDPQAVVAGFERTLDALTERRTIKSFPAPNPANFAGPELKATVKVWAGGFEPAKLDGKTDPKDADKAEPKPNGKPVVLEFGKKEGDSIHVRRTDANGVQEYFLLPEKVKVGPVGEQIDLLAAVTKSRLDLLDPNLKSFAPDAASKVTVSGEANYELEKDEKPDFSTGAALWRFAAPADQKGKAVDAFAIGDLLHMLGTQSVSKFIEEVPTPEKLAEYGLGPVPGQPPMPGAPPAPRLKVVVALRGTDPADKERVYEFGKETGDGSVVYARQAGRNVVFTVQRRVYDKLKATSDLRDKSIFKVDPNEVAKIQITGWGDTLGSPTKLVLGKNKDGAWEVLEGPNKYGVDPLKVAAFLSEIGNARVKSFTTDKLEPGDRHKFNDEKQRFDVVLLKADGGHHLYLRLGGQADPGGTELYAISNRLPADQSICTVDASLLKQYRQKPGVFAK